MGTVRSRAARPGSCDTVANTPCVAEDAHACTCQPIWNRQITFDFRAATADKGALVLCRPIGLKGGEQVLPVETRRAFRSGERSGFPLQAARNNLTWMGRTSTMA